MMYVLCLVCGSAVHNFRWRNCGWSCRYRLQRQGKLSSEDENKGGEITMWSSHGVTGATGDTSGAKGAGPPSLDGIIRGICTKSLRNMFSLAVFFKLNNIDVPPYSGDLAAPLVDGLPQTVSSRKGANSGEPPFLLGN